MVLQLKYETLLTLARNRKDQIAELQEELREARAANKSAARQGSSKLNLRNPTIRKRRIDIENAARRYALVSNAFMKKDLWSTLITLDTVRPTFNPNDPVRYTTPAMTRVGAIAEIFNSFPQDLHELLSHSEFASVVSHSISTPLRYDTESHIGTYRLAILWVMCDQT